MDPVKFAAKFDGNELSSMGTQIWLDGNEIGHVRSMHVHAEVGDVRRVELEMIQSSLDIAFPAAVSVTVSVLPGFEVIATPQADGSTRYQSMKIHDGYDLRGLSVKP